MKKLFIIFFIIFVSCSKSKNIDAIYVNLGAEPKTIDPALNITLQGSTYVTHLFECLTTKYKDIEIQPGAAESWDISEDGLTYIFHLRTNAKWSDGKPLTAYDFEYSWKRMVNPEVAAKYSSMMEIIKNGREINEGNMDYNELSANALDDYTFEVNLVDPAAYFLEFITTMSVFAPVREDIIELYGDNWTLKPETFICNGPYKMTERLMDQYIIFEENTNYYAPNEIVAKKLKFMALVLKLTSMLPKRALIK